MYSRVIRVQKKAQTQVAMAAEEGSIGWHKALYDMMMCSDKPHLEITQYIVLQYDL